MRSLVTSPVFLMKKKLFNFLNWVMPRTFIPLYTMVSAINVQDVIGKAVLGSRVVVTSKTEEEACGK